MLGFLKKLFKGQAGGPGCAHGPTATPEEDIAIAGAVMAAGELKHAAFHIGGALTSDPTRAEWLALLDRLITIAPDPLALAPLEENNYVGTVAVRAYVLNHLGRLDDALDTLFQAALAKPDTPYLEWAVRWLDAPENRGKTDGAPLMRFMRATFDQPELLSDPKAHALTEPLPRLIDALRRTQKPGPEFAVAAARILRTSGHAAAALELAREAYRDSPGYVTAIALAATLRDAGETDEALAAYRAAADADPKDAAALLDMGDLCWQHGRREEAQAHYEEATRREPKQPWATPSLCVLRYEMTGNAEWLDTLADYASANPNNERARDLASRSLLPYFGSFLPDPGEATINAVRQMLEQNGGKVSEFQGDINVGVSGLEAPSALHSLRREMKRHGFPGSVNVSVKNVAKPDPRVARGAVDCLLWRYEGTAAQPAVDAPPARIAELAAAVARTPYSLDLWWRQARAAMANEPSRGREAIPGLLATMVHPPAPPEGVPDWTWTYRLQFAAAFLLAAVEPETPWPQSARRRALLSLVRGPMDWSVEAGIVALAVAASEEAADAAAVAEEAKAVLFETLKGAPREGYVCYRDTALLALARLPNLSDRERADVNRQYRELNEDE